MSELTEEQKAKLRENLALAREARAAKKAAAAASSEDAPLPMPPVPREGESAPVIGLDEPLPVAEPPAEDDFERFLALQDEETRSVLSDMDLRVIYETEKTRAKAERKEKIKKQAQDRAQRHARLTAGLLTPQAIEAAGLRDRLSRKVKWTVNMPEAGNTGRLIDQGIRIDGRLLHHGTEIVGTLAEYISYREIEWRAHQNELDFQGKGRMSRLRRSVIPDANTVMMG